MRPAINERIGHGAVGGLLAGLTVALWFLVVDSLAGRPFHTPAVLAGALARQDIMAPTFRIVAAYTVVHFAVFALLGVAMAAAIGALRLPPRLLLGVPFGLVAQELVFYAGLLLSGTPRVAVVPWPHVVAANVLSGWVLMWYLHRAQPDEGALGLAALKGHPLLARGLVTGLIGAGVVALALGAQWVLGTLGTWSVLVANVLAVTAMGWYVWETHPLLRHRLTHEAIRVHT